MFTLLSQTVNWPWRISSCSQNWGHFIELLHDGIWMKDKDESCQGWILLFILCTWTTGNLSWVGAHLHQGCQTSVSSAFCGWPHSPSVRSFLVSPLLRSFDPCKVVVKHLTIEANPGSDSKHPWLSVFTLCYLLNNSKSAFSPAKCGVDNRLPFWRHCEDYELVIYKMFTTYGHREV